MSNGSSFAISPFTIVGANTPTIAHVTLTLSSIEYPLALPAGTGTFLIKIRSGGGRVFFGYAPGSSSTLDSIDISAGGWFGAGNILNTVLYTLYFQSPVAGTIVVVESWLT